MEVVVAEVFQQNGHDLVAEGGNDLKKNEIGQFRLG